MDSGERIWTDYFWFSIRYSRSRTGFNHDRGFVTFERGYCFFTIPDRAIMPFKPKSVVRGDTKFIKNLWMYPSVTPQYAETLRAYPDLTLKIRTGLLDSGGFTLAFDSKEDADKVEQELRKMLPIKKLK